MHNLDELTQSNSHLLCLLSVTFFLTYFASMQQFPIITQICSKYLRQKRHVDPSEFKFTIDSLQENTDQTPSVYPSSANPDRHCDVKNNVW